MTNPVNHIQAVGEIVQELGRLNLEPILVGGMALVIMGSRRVTRDFDFVITKPDAQLKEMFAIFYDRGFEMAAQIDSEGDISLTIDSPTVAAIRLKIDAPDSIFLVNRKTGLRIDLLFDFPISAAELSKNAKPTKVNSQTITVASPKDLLRLKEIAQSARKAPGDAQDIEFLKNREERKA